MSVDFPQGFAYGMAQGPWTTTAPTVVPHPPSAAGATLTPPSQQMDLRRASSIADVFGLQAQSSAVVRSPSTYSDLAKGSTASRARFVPPPPKPLFQFRSHEAVRSFSKQRQSSAAFEMTGNFDDPDGGGGVRRFQSARRSQVAARALSVRSLSHLMVEPKKATLLLPGDQQDDVASDQSISDRDDKDSVDADGALPPVDELWREVRATRRQQSRSKPQGEDHRLRPRWWRHLSLRDFSDFLTPGLFDGEEMDASSVSSADEVQATNTRVVTGLERDASIAGQPASTRLPSSVSSNSVANDAARSVKRMQVPQRVPPLSIDHSNVAVWTQHIMTRHPNHWITPRRHAMRNGKSTAELGTQTTVSIRDYGAAFSSLASILSVRERVNRLDISREEYGERALLFQKEIFARWCTPTGDDRRSKAPEPVRLLAVVESDQRDDITENAFRELQWIVTEYLLLPAQEALVRRDAATAMNTYLGIIKELSEFDKDAAEDEMKQFFGAGILDESNSTATD